jgi:hypothetical protein
MRNKAFYMKRALLFISIVALVIVTACSSAKEKDSIESSDNLPEVELDDQLFTAFAGDVDYLTEKGIVLPNLQPNSAISLEQFLVLMTKAYEGLGTEIDISKVNPRYEDGEAIKKMALIEVYDNRFVEEDNIATPNLDYGSAGYLLMKLHDAVSKRLYWRSDTTATTGDLLRRINTSTALHAWTETAEKNSTFTLDDLMEDNVTIDQPLTRLMAAEMMVSAFEKVGGEIPVTNTFELADTDNLYAIKSNTFFFWADTNFEPEKTGSWDDWSFLSAIIFDGQLRVTLKLEESRVPYGAVVAALATLLRDYEGFEQHLIKEKIVLNERPYDWHVYQQETGEYSDVNCMPSTVEMAIRYQGLSDVPNAEELRNDHPSNGIGWNDVLAEQVMLQYGLKFTDYLNAEMNIDEMLASLDQGNVLYVMYREEDNPEGHSVMIKGYWKLGNSLNFIIADPNHNKIGPFGYLEVTKDAQMMLLDIERHVPRYFIIPSGDTERSF